MAPGGPVCSGATFMFTGIIEETGQVAAIEPRDEAWRLEIAAHVVLEDAEVGASIAVDGCCLTVAATGRGRLCFDVLQETWRLTTFGALREGVAVNLERSLPVGGRLGGHFVTGHIDGVGLIDVFEPRGSDHYLRVRAPRGSAPRLVHKGSVAVDGISLTVAETEGDTFSAWVIPHTLEITGLREKQAGQGVNLEFDLLGKYVEKLIALRAPAA